MRYPTVRCVHCTLMRCYHIEVCICDECMAEIRRLQELAQ